MKPDKEWIKEFVELYNRDIPPAKYRIGDVIKYTHSHEGSGTGKILAVNDADGAGYTGIEYAIEGLNFLLWESEIYEKI